MRTGGRIAKEVKEKSRIGIGSFAYRYAVGFENFTSPDPMSIESFLQQAASLDYEGVQICENTAYSTLDEDRLIRIKDKAAELNLFIEIGMNGLTYQNVQKHIYLAGLLDSRFIRIVIGGTRPGQKPNADMVKENAVTILKKIIPDIENNNLMVGIENHFDLPTNDLVEIVEKVDCKRVGLIYDTTNGLGFNEDPYYTLKIMAPYLFSIHLKDYHIRKVEAGYLITGTILGRGWLDVENILTQAVKANPVISIILEMTIRREKLKSPDEIVKWEKEAVIASTDYLKEILKI